MKNILLLLIIFALRGQVSAQFTLEHTYDSASYITHNSLYMVVLEVDSYKYVRIYQTQLNGVPGPNRQLRFYNLDHSVWKTVDMSGFPANNYQGSIGYDFSVLYISQHLFNTDDSLEFMFVGNTGIGCAFTNIYNEAGRLLFTADSLGPFINIHVPQEMKPIYNTPQGTKMILSHLNGTANVYSLQGTLTNIISMMPGQNTGGFDLHPTPTSQYTKVDFALPEGVEEATLSVFGASGAKVKEYKVDRSFSNIIVNSSELAPGNYIFSLQYMDNVISRKQVIIH